MAVKHYLIDPCLHARWRQMQRLLPVVILFGQHQPAHTQGHLQGGRHGQPEDR